MCFVPFIRSRSGSRIRIGITQRNFLARLRRVAPPASAPAATPQPVPDEVAAAEAAIASSDWKTAEAKLDPWLAAHPTDARALFDAGYVADAQNRLDDAAALYRRAIAADPKSFEAHISLGLLLARQNKLDEARPELVAATTLDPGEAGPALKARAWRALARIDRDSDPAEASNDLLEALKLSPETPADTLLAAELAEKTGQNDAAEAAYRRVLAKDPNPRLPAPAWPTCSSSASSIPRPKPSSAPRSARIPTTPRSPRSSPPCSPIRTMPRPSRSSKSSTPPIPPTPPSPACWPRSWPMPATTPAPTSSTSISLPPLPTIPICWSRTARTLCTRRQLAEAYAVFDKATQIDPANADGWSGLAFTASRTGHPDVTVHALDHALTLPAGKRLHPLPLGHCLRFAAPESSRPQPTTTAFSMLAAGKFPNQEWQARQRLQSSKNRPATVPGRRSASFHSGRNAIRFLGPALFAASKSCILFLAVCRAMWLL